MVSGKKLIKSYMRECEMYSNILISYLVSPQYLLQYYDVCAGN